jgi:hypothetical protein
MADGEESDMAQPLDDDTAYGPDQDREATSTAPGDPWQDAADRSPDDFDADREDST